MKKIMILAAMAAGLAAPLAAQDWSGAYVGATLGSGGATIADNYDSVQTFDFDADGTLSGLKLGYNLQNGSLVYGVEASLSFGKMTGSGSCPDPDCPGSGTAPEATMERMATLGLRLGVAKGKALYYATLGKARADGFVNDPVQGGSDGHRHSGWVAGLGADWMISDKLSFGVEYIYGRFDDIDYALVSTPDVIGFETREIQVSLKLGF